jgi:hypothetical protein
MLLPPQPGCCSVAPFAPHAVQRARWRNMSLDVPGPHRMTAAANANGARCRQRSHHNHVH